MKYFIAIFATAVIVFLGATIYYKGLPQFISPKGVSVTSTEVATTPEPSESPATISKEDLAVIIKTALVKKHGSSMEAMNVTVSEIDGEYAKGGASGEGGGGMWFAARQNGIWTLVWDGNGIITCDDVSPFPEFPATMIPECWDVATNKLITR